MKKQDKVRYAVVGLGHIAQVAACDGMIDATRDRGVRFMNAYRLHFERATLEALALARPSARSRNGRGRRGKLGDLRFFSSEFSMQVRDNPTRLDRDLGGGPL